MEQTDDTNRILRTATGRKDLKQFQEKEQQTASLPGKMDRRFEGLMKVLREITYKHKYLEKEEVQGTRKRASTSVECQRKTTFRP